MTVKIISEGFTFHNTCLLRLIFDSDFDITSLKPLPWARMGLRTLREKFATKQLFQD